ncbi:hypothetical protein AUC70_15695 [Methyloceanibacter stevinii]|uniref:Uncharacterized protein n=1 Tax=Methyloceanibacter stevinii TaxID=1774970 RepID=A0A1E3VTP1_9HYPH|nr:hypothetical protein [Methyloceanibacter stevinii]ODR96326.1 hypothetical protein AUC70_15695 [Methyloceanibacter stevinii]
MANIFAGRFRKMLLAAWVVIGTWDTMVAQFLPRSWAVKMPNVYEILAKTSGFFDWWVWLVVGAVMTTIFSIEYAHRRNGVPVSSPSSEKNGMSAPIIGMVIFGLGFLGCLVWWISSGEHPEDNRVEADPLRWSFLADTPGAKNFLMGKTTDYGVEIRGFQAYGKNATGEYLGGLKGEVRSARNGKVYPLLLHEDNDLVPLEGRGIPDGNQFGVRTLFFGGNGIPVVQFLSEFGALTFIIEYGGKTFTHRFTEEEVWKQAEWLDEELKPKPKRSNYGPSREGSNSYATQLRHAAIGYRDGIVVGRLKATIDRCAARQWDRLVTIMPEQRLHSDDLMNADKSKLSPRQVELVTAYQLREAELENYVKAVEDGRYSGVQAAKSFRHRVQQLSSRLDQLIEDWNS